MDLLDYVIMQIKKGRNPSELEQFLIKSGYPVYKIENALAIAGITKNNPSSFDLKNAPVYVFLFALSGFLTITGVVMLMFYFI